jgi:voltage-gated potassium channel
MEYGVRLWCAQSKVKFIFSLFSILDLLAIIPLFLGIIDVRFLRIFRWFRFLRMIQFIELQLFIFKINTFDGIILGRILLTLFSLIFVYAGLIYQVEHPRNAQEFRNFFDALYFSVVTMTTVGFGDVTPLSEPGRVVTLMMILSGIILIPWQIGELIRQLLRTIAKQPKKCLNCGLMFHDFDARFCKNCGYSLEKIEKINNIK